MKKLLKNISWIFSANIFAAFSKWLLLVLIARILTPNDVGVYSLAFAITAPIALFFNLKLRSLVVTDREIKFSNYIFTRNTMSLVAMMFIAILGIIIYPEYFIIIALVGLNKIYDLHSELYYSIPQINRKFNIIGQLKIFKHFLILTSFTISLFIYENLILSLSIQVLMQIFVFYVIEKRFIKRTFLIKKNKVNKSDIKKIIFLGIPLGISVMMVSLTVNIPRYILESLNTAELLGYFSAASYVVVIGNLIMGSVTQNFLPILTSKLNKNKIKDFKMYVFVYLTFFSAGLGVITILFSYLFGEWFLLIVYGKEYADYSRILIMMGYAMAFNFISWNFDTALMAMRYIKIQPKISLIVLVLSVVIGLLMIDKYGIDGAAITIIITNIIQLVLRGVFVVYGLKRRI